LAVAMVLADSLLMPRTMIASGSIRSYVQTMRGTYWSELEPSRGQKALFYGAEVDR
jgi:hypothetical protein